MSDTTVLVESYLQVWNETDPTVRRAAIQEVFADDATYTDPLADVAGIDGIDAVIGAVQVQLLPRQGPLLFFDPPRVTNAPPPHTQGVT